MTFYHHVEEILGVNYRYLKDFTFKYFDNFSNNLGLCNYSIYVRDLEAGVITNVDPMGEKLKLKDFIFTIIICLRLKQELFHQKLYFQKPIK